MYLGFIDVVKKKRVSPFRNILRIQNPLPPPHADWDGGGSGMGISGLRLSLVICLPILAHSFPGMPLIWAKIRPYLVTKYAVFKNVEFDSSDFIET